MDNLIYTISGPNLTLYIDGVPHTLHESHPNFNKVVEAIQHKSGTVDDLLKLISIRQYVKGLNIGSITITNDSILYKGQEVTGHLVNRMLEILAAGFDITPWAKFMENLMLNPSKQAVDELFLWLEKANLPITPDGCFVAYKKVKDDYTSYHNNKDGSVFDNKMGTTVEMPRNQVDDRRDNTCSTGLHFCSYHYLPHYYGDQGRVLLLKINPADVVSIPSDYDNAKGRASKYHIYSEVDRDKVKFAFGGSPVVAAT